MTIAANVIDAIGKTPLIELRAASKATGCRILGKAEFMNPGGSVKDRAALYIVRDAIARGTLAPGGVIVEGTAGNTGIGLALVANALGFSTVIVIPETQSQEKKDTLRLQGARLVEVPAVPYANPNNYVKLSGRLADRLAGERAEGAIWANQFDNLANREAHIETTGPEIYDELGGDVDGFICACGTGGTLAGVGLALKARNQNIKIGLADPMGAALYSYYTSGELKASGSSITEGIGQGRDHRESRRRASGFRLPDHGRRGAADCLRSRPERGPAARRLIRDKCRGRHSPRARIGSGPHHRDRARRRRRTLCVQAVQSGVLARAEAADAGVAGGERGD